MTMPDHQEHDTADVRQWLAGVEPASPWPSPFDAGEAVRRGRLRRRRHRLAALGAVAAAVLALAAVPALAGLSSGTRPSVPGASGRPSTGAPPAVRGPADCRIVDLPVPGGLAAAGVTQPSRVFVTAMDPSGSYVVAGAFGASNYLAAVILWHDRVPTVLPLGGPGPVESVVAVNSRGVVAGTGEAAGQGYAWVYRDGVFTRLPNVDGYHRLVEVDAVNDSGDVLGSALSESGDRSAVLVWPAADPGQPRVQSALTGKVDGLIAATYTDDGDIRAWSAAATSPAAASLRTLWSGDGRRRLLPVPAGFASAGISGVRGSWAFGTATRKVPASRQTPAGGLTPAGKKVRATGGGQVPVRWDLRTGTVEVVAGTLPTYNMDLGVMPAFAASEATGGGEAAPSFTALAGGRVFLLPASGGAASPVAVDDDGSVVAGSVGPAGDNDYGGRTRPVLWQC